MDGIFLGHNLLLSQASRWESLDGWDFGYQEALFTNSFFFSRWNFGYHGALHANFFLFSRWNFGYHGALHANFFLFFTMEFRLSRSPSHELFFFFHDGILAMKEPFTRNFLFSRWNSGYQGAFHTNFSFFAMEFWLSGSLSHEIFFFHDGILDTKYETCNLGEDSFHLYIGKSIYTGSALLKTLPLDLEPPLQGKEYGPSYSRTTIKA
jgi:hypothetical protein